MVRNALQFFYKHVLEKQWDWINIVKPPKVQTLPDILTQAEVSIVLNAVHKLTYRVFIFVVYSMGLRLGEALNLRPCDIDAEHHQVHIRCAKGGKSRRVPLPDTTLSILRKYGSTHRNRQLIFPSRKGKLDVRRTTKTPMDCGAVQIAIRAAVDSCGIPRLITIRSLRHNYAYKDVGMWRKQDAEAARLI